MIKQLLFLSLIIAAIALPSFGGDLYKITVRDQSEAQHLSALGIEPLLVISDGYLAIADPAAADRLRQSGLEIILLAQNITREQLALDNRLDNANLGKYPLLFQDQGVRLYQIEPTELYRTDTEPGLIPILTQKIEIKFTPAVSALPLEAGDEISLDTLINKIVQDSLYSYTARLQAYYRRVTATDSNLASRDWIFNKFVEFGYDSVFLDPFPATIYGVPRTCYNVVAVKVGTVLPDHHIIVGAHRDGVSTSPAADDNGSGTAGVLEIARALQNVNTDLTFIFILFDAEEQGLHGSWHYANDAKARGDSIVYMFNMDMIGDEDNSTTAALYYGTDMTYSQLWDHLADSLVGISSNYKGNIPNSDHYPFTQNGYRATFLAEFVLSSYYHGPRDSTTHMNFEYMTRMVKASVATVYRVSSSYAAAGVFYADYPGGLPSLQLSGDSASFEVVVGGTLGAEPVSGTGQLHYSVDGALYTTTPLAELEANRYLVSLPQADCFSTIEYYLSFVDLSDNTHYSPDSLTPRLVIVADDSTVSFQDNFQANTGWSTSGSATGGHWNRGVPVGGGDRGDPPSDFDGSGQCFATDYNDGDTDVDNGTTILTSPVFDLSAGYGKIHYARWFSNSSGSAPFEDTMKVYLSNDNGANWSMVETIGPTWQASGGWYERDIWVSDYITPTALMRIRFEASDFGSASLVEAGVDAFWANSYACIEFVCGDVNHNGLVNIQDVTGLINFLYKSGAAPDPYRVADANGDTLVNIQDITWLINFLYKDGATPLCQ